MKLKGGIGDSAFKIAVIAILLVILYFIYLSWVWLTSFGGAFTSPDIPDEKDEDEIKDYIKDYNKLFQKIIDIFI